jgi:hypothetical protein
MKIKRTADFYNKKKNNTFHEKENCDVEKLN